MGKFRGNYPVRRSSLGFRTGAKNLVPNLLSENFFSHILFKDAGLLVYSTTKERFQTTKPCWRANFLLAMALRPCERFRIKEPFIRCNQFLLLIHWISNKHNTNFFSMWTFYLHELSMNNFEYCLKDHKVLSKSREQKRKCLFMEQSHTLRTFLCNDFLTRFRRLNSQKIWYLAFKDRILW